MDIKKITCEEVKSILDETGTFFIDVRSQNELGYEVVR